LFLFDLGYFQQFVHQHKKTLEDLQEKKTESNGNTRYSHKPIMITSLQTQNKFFQLTSLGLAKEKGFSLGFC